MLLVDPRLGSGDLLEPLQKRLNGQARVAKPMLPSGDIAFDGWGPGGLDVMIGIELKALGDMLASMRSGRYIDQLNRMREDYQVIYLFIEGVWRPSADGLIETPVRGGWVKLSYQYTHGSTTKRTNYYYYSELDKFITSIEMKRDVIVRRIPHFPRSNRNETIQQIVNLYNWWQKEWDSHDSVESVKLQAGNPIAGRASVLRMVAAQLPGIGWELSSRVEKHFKSVERMAGALPSEWMAIEWKSKSGRKQRISERLALEVCKAIKEQVRP